MSSTRTRNRGAAWLSFPIWAWLLFFVFIPLGLVAWYSFGYKPSEKKYWLYYTLGGSTATTQVFLSPTQVTATAAMFNASSATSYETAAGYFSSAPRTF